MSIGSSGEHVIPPSMGEKLCAELSVNLMRHWNVPNVHMVCKQIRFIKYTIYTLIYGMIHPTLLALNSRT